MGLSSYTLVMLPSVVAAVLQSKFVDATIGEWRCNQRRTLMLPSVAELLLAGVGSMQCTFDGGIGGQTLSTKLSPEIKRGRDATK
jgi:hypothetical protein